MKKITAFGFGIMIGAVGSKMVDTVMDKYVFTMENFARLVGLQARINSRFDDMEDVNAFKTEITKYLIYHPSCDGLTVKNVYDLIDRVTTRPARRSNVDYSMFRWNRDALLNLKIDTACFHNGYWLTFPTPEINYTAKEEPVTPFDEKEEDHVYAEPGMYEEGVLLDIESLHPSSFIVKELHCDKNPFDACNIKPEEKNKEDSI